MHRSLASASAAFLIAQSLVFPLFASRFPDVTAEHIYRVQIEDLADRGIIKGNPDGTFAPGQMVNRAAFLTMLYRARGWTPDSPSTPCFNDVPANAWFSAVVCDAATKRFVAGYADGNFRPEMFVNRVEALKMIFTVLELPVSELSNANRGDVKFVDVSLSAWYTKYLVSAFAVKVLPIAGHDGSRFLPENPLNRGEAAAYIHSALHGGTQEESSASSVENESQGASSSAGVQATASAAVELDLKNVGFPFSDAGTFDERRPAVYRFPLNGKTMANVKVLVEDDAGGERVSCRLYRLGDEGFSEEYYLGFQNDRECSMRVALGAGSYQLEIQPKSAGVRYELDVSTTSGDGNDGFSEAKLLQMNLPRSGFIEVGDFADWYYFSVKQETNMKIEMTYTGKLTCMIYPMDDVDIYGFVGPSCNDAYDFPPGTYYLGVIRADGDNGEKHTYTVRMK